MGGLYVQKNEGNIKFKLKNDNIKKVLRNYENNQLCASMLGRHLFNWIELNCFISDLVFSFIQNTNKEFWNISQYTTTIRLINMKHYFSFKEAIDDFESHVFLQSVLKGFWITCFLQSVLKELFSTTIQSFFIILVTDLKRFETLFKPHL